jgi:hypothetical protein
VEHLCLGTLHEPEGLVTPLQPQPRPAWHLMNRVLSGRPNPRPPPTPTDSSSVVTTLEEREAQRETLSLPPFLRPPPPSLSRALSLSLCLSLCLSLSL